MAEVSWCDECGRMVGIGCACGMSFKEKLQSLAYATEWMPNGAPIEAPQAYLDKFPNSKLSKDRPADL